MSDFRSLGVPQQLVSTLNDRGITSPTPIQAATLPDSLQGRDVLGRGRTGSGKTFAFLLPTAARLASAAGRAGTSSGSARRVPGRPRALVLAPTRELATQIAESFDPLAQATGLTWATIFGGVGQGPQVSALNRGVDVAIACPGRLLDLMGQGHVSLDGIEITVLDEADHMADMGFLPMVTQILDRIPRGGQRMLFSATLDGGVNGLVKKYLSKPVVHEADSAHLPVSAMDHHVLEVDGGNKVAVVGDLAAAPGKTMVFTRTKHGAKNLARRLRGLGVPAVELHGNLSQGARTRNMDAFHSGRVNVMVATDIAARGIHVDDVALVVHADPPVEHKAYLHRSGRTARAGAAGTVITIQTPEQRGEVNSLMRAAKITATRSGADSSVLHELAPGERVFVSRAEAEQLATPHKTEQQKRQQHPRQRKTRQQKVQQPRQRKGPQQKEKQHREGQRKAQEERGARTRGRSGSTRAAPPTRAGGLAAFSAGGRRGR